MILALAFVTLPFIVRTVQPVLAELDARRRGGRRVARRQPDDHLPPDHPALADPGDRGGRGPVVRPRISEYGSLVLLCGNLPYKTEVVSVRVLSFIEGGNRPRPRRVATIMLAVALVVIVGTRRHPAKGGPPWLGPPAPGEVGGPRSLVIAYVFLLVGWPMIAASSRTRSPTAWPASRRPSPTPT